MDGKTLEEDWNRYRFGREREEKRKEEEEEKTKRTIWQFSHESRSDNSDRSSRKNKQKRSKSIASDMMMSKRRNVYHVSQDCCDDPKTYCDCPLHKGQRTFENNNNNSKTFTTWLSNIQLARPESAQSRLRPTKSLKGDRPTLANYNNSLSVEYDGRFSGSSGDLLENDGGSDISRSRVRLQGITRRGTMYPMRTSVSSSEFAGYYNSLGRQQGSLKVCLVNVPISVQYQISDDKI